MTYSRESMLDGWGKQQLSRNFKVDTIRTRKRLVRRFVDHSEHFPWDWSLADVDDFFAHARSISNLSFSTVRSYQTHLKLFCDYLRDRPNQRTGNKNSDRLFPSTIAGQHIHADTLMGKLRTIGIDLAGARNATLRDLVAELPPTLVARALGYSPQVIHLHAADAAVPMASYASMTPTTTPRRS